MPVVAPKVKVVRVQTPIPKGSNVSVIDLGIVTVAEVVTHGAKVLVPYAPGRLIRGVYFSVDGLVPTDSTLFVFATPNNIVSGDGLAFLTDSDLNNSTDIGPIRALATTATTVGLVSSNSGSSAWDVSPLVAVYEKGANWWETPVTWQANTAYTTYSNLIDSNGHLQCLILAGGVSGSTEPVWDTSGGTTTDGTAVWTDLGLVSSFAGAVHAYAEVIELGSSSIIYPASIEILQQPTNVVAGQVISPPITVRLLDQNGSPYLIQNAAISVFILGAGTLGGSAFQIIDQTTGIATFNNLTIAETGTGYVLQFLQIPNIGVTRISSNPFNVT